MKVLPSAMELKSDNCIASIIQSDIQYIVQKEKLRARLIETTMSEEKEDEETHLLRSRSSERKSRIRFSTIETRQFNRTLGDNPACRHGPPVCLDWDYVDAESVSIDEYEAKCVRRPENELYLSTFIRRRMMSVEFGYTIPELEQAEKSIKKIQKSRLKTKNERLKGKRSQMSCY